MYKYSNIPLTPVIASKIIMELFQGEVAKRANILHKVLEHHIKSGGGKPQGDLVPIIKKALQVLCKNGTAENVSTGSGFYRFNALNKPVEMEKDGSDFPFEEGKTIEVGVGDESVYLYYRPSEKRSDELDGLDNWRIKIGKTTNTTIHRGNQQSGTGFSERPMYPLIIKTNNCFALEKMIHGMLLLLERKVHTAPGQEWFYTTPNEVISLVSRFDPNIVKPYKVID